MQPSITVNVDPTNPGQFFACCGLLEIAHRLSGNAEGWFEEGQFKINSNISFSHVLACLRELDVTSLDPDEDKAPPLSIRANGLSMRLDWWTDTLTGGSIFKTWAGQQKVESILGKLLADLNVLMNSNQEPTDLLNFTTGTRSVPFYFNSVTGSHSSSIDVGYSMDALSGNNTTRQIPVTAPATEVLAFIGLQRFRPARKRDAFTYQTWSGARSPILSAAIQHIHDHDTKVYSFELLYRTKYLKAFLTAQHQPSK